MERRREFAAANPQAESYLEREHNARWAALGVAHATSGITANVLTLLWPRSILATSSILTYKVRRAKRWNNGNRVPITMSGFTKEQYTGVMQMLDLDATPQEGMIFHCAGQASGGWRVFDIWDLQGAFDQFLRQAARLIAKDPHFPQPSKDSINFQIQNLLPESSLSPLRNRGINLPSGCPADHQLLAECTGIRVLHCRNTTK
jgi:hypothetical protein